ncbi:probable serine/threonine-protein kinase clkA [Danaus plexippus]|uniref:probable serine/threonine-protein kinase clkA n=1 Tax=Danaus plexippus TaxID=13037 RepID=UPI002AB1A0BB|nr:probable serine/threonine-protein kinase clkA [Danaus plexippus]
MLQPESRLCIILNIFFIARENVFGLKTDAVCSNYDLLQNKPMTSKIVDENEIKYYDFVNDDKHFTNKPEINANSIDPIRDDLNKYMNIETNDKAEIVGSAEDANDCLCEQTEYESSEPENLVESNKNDNLTYVYITGMDDSLVELKRNIQKYGKGHELIVNFYLYKNQKWYDLGYLYTDAYILRYFIPNYEKKFCVVNSKNNWCFDNLSKKHYLKDFNIETESSKFDKEVENFQPMVAESKNVCKLIEYVPTEVDGHYELNIPKEQQYTDENILDNYHQNNLRKQNTNLNNNISPQISLLETEDLGSSQTVINNNIDYPEEEHDANTVEVATGHKVCYKQDVNMLGEAIKNKYDMSSNVITYDDSNKESRIDRNSSMDTIKSNELTNDNEIFYKINENNLNYIPINTISDKESDCNYLTHPCSAKASNNDIVRTENNYELLKGIDSYDENNAARTELGYHLQYDDGTGTKGCDKCSKTNEAFRYNLAIPNMVSTPRYVGVIKTIVNPLSVVETPKLMFFPYQTHLIPNQQAKTNDMVSINDVPDSKIVYRNYNDNESILTRPQASVEQKIENVFKEYVPNYDLQSQVQSSPIPYEEATLTDNNIINDVQQPIKQDTYLNMPDIVITPMLVYSVREVPTLNFMPIRNSKYAMGEDIEIARKYVAQKYGDPMVIRGVYSAYKPYAYINDSGSREIQYLRALPYSVPDTKFDSPFRPGAMQDSKVIGPSASLRHSLHLMLQTPMGDGNYFP